MKTVMIIAGGTGGHVFPALAVANRLRTLGIGVVWLGTRQGLEARVVLQAGIDMERVSIRGLRRGGLLGWLLMPFRLLLAMWQSWRALRRRRPDVVVSFGGFVAGPGSLVARLTGSPLLIHEQNAAAGLTNRWLARIADVVMCGFPEAFGDAHGVRQVGNPVREQILALDPPEQRLAGRAGRLRLLVVGGSQGAAIFNRIVPQAVRALPTAERPEVWHQTGRREQAQTVTAYGQVTARVDAFIDDMAAAYAWADVVLCRAGAMTIAELAAAGAASILVPYPTAVDDHQTANARFLALRDAAILVPQSAFTTNHVAELLHSFAANRELVARMSRNARGCAVPDATGAVVQLIGEVLSSGGVTHA